MALTPPPPAPGEDERRTELRRLLACVRTDSRTALGVAPGATSAQVRTAFLAAARRYHPVRFARFSSETVRLANETFIAIKEAFDALEHTSARLSSPRRPSTPRSRLMRVTLPGGGLVGVVVRGVDRHAPKRSPGGSA